MDAYMQSLPIDAQCLLTGLMAMVGMLVLVGVINIIESIFPSAGDPPEIDAPPPWEIDGDDYTGAER